MFVSLLSSLLYSPVGTLLSFCFLVCALVCVCFNWSISLLVSFAHQASLLYFISFGLFWFFVCVHVPLFLLLFAGFCTRHLSGVYLLFLVSVLSQFSRVWLFETRWTVARQAPVSMGFSRQEFWRGFPLPSPGHLPDPEIEPMSFMSPALAGEFFTTSATVCLL